jgi:hypothetical protein
MWTRGFFFKIWTVPERLPPIGQWSIFCYKSILKGEILGYMFFLKIACGQMNFFSIKPNWLLRFHGYQTFADYLNFHSIILVITKLCLFNYYSDTNFPWAIEPRPQRVLPTTTRGCNKGVLHPLIALHNLEIPLLTSKPNQHDCWHTQFYNQNRNLQSTIQLDISLSPPSIMQLHHHMGN